MIKQIGLPLGGRSILLITGMITDRIGRHKVLLPLLIDIADVSVVLADHHLCKYKGLNGKLKFGTKGLASCGKHDMAGMASFLKKRKKPVKLGVFSFIVDQ